MDACSAAERAVEYGRSNQINRWSSHPSGRGYCECVTKARFSDLFLDYPKIKLIFSFNFYFTKDLRQTVFGSAAAPPRGEWTRTGLIFGLPHQELPYGLRCPRNATRGLQSVLQAHIIKYLLFDCRHREKSLPLDVSVPG